MNNSYEYRRTERKLRRKRRMDHSLRIRASVVLCLLVLFFAGINSITVNAGADTNKVQTKPAMTKVYSTYTVQRGDNLTSIARDYCNPDYYDSYEDFILEVCNINHISSNMIYAGSSITIPQYI